MGYGSLRTGIRCHAAVLCGESRLDLDVVGSALTDAIQGRWWYGSRKLTKDGVLNTSAATFFVELKEETTLAGLLDIIASADEFVEDSSLVKLRKSAGKAGVDEYARLASIVRDKDGKHGGWEGYTTGTGGKKWSVGKKRARVLIAAHMLRIPIKDATLIRGEPIPDLAVGSVLISCVRLQKNSRPSVSLSPSSAPSPTLPSPTTGSQPSSPPCTCSNSFCKPSTPRPPPSSSSLTSTQT